MTALLEHEAFISIYGVIFWYAGLFVFNHSAARKKKQGLTFGQWLNNKKWNIAFTFMAIPWIIVFDDEIVNKWNTVASNEYDLEQGSKLIYAMTGPVSEWIIRQIEKLF